MIPEIKKILYATDLSPNSAYALRYAINSAKKHDAGIIILHVVEERAPFFEEERLKAISEKKNSRSDGSNQKAAKDIL